MQKNNLTFIDLLDFNCKPQPITGKGKEISLLELLDIGYLFPSVTEKES